ncbi:MAG: hypothetical protein EA361_18655 [Bacteroidetes bacterium]|nr:MAG: hypothetical protein EA361_18655 [Bacteroidota bacterium]
MKKLTLWFAIAALLFALYPAQLNAESYIHASSANAEMGMIASAEPGKALLAVPDAELAMVSSAETAQTAYAYALEERLNQINDMDMSAMSSSEKNELRKEVRAIEKQQRGGGIYISVGAAILIVLLLILLL